jgi:uncharacterized membrane protein
VSAALLSLTVPLLDAAIATSGWSLPGWIRTTTPTARATLSAMVGAMVAVTGTVFSITIVTLSLTSQQFGPRLLRRFMYDLPTQVTLGVFLSTGLYCLLILRIVEHHDGGAAAPHLSVLLAVMLSVLSIAMLIVFIHHVAILIQAPHVVAAMARDLDDAIARLFPEEIGDAVRDEQHQNGDRRDQAGRLGENYLVVRSTRDGYIQAIDEDGLMQLARERDLVFRLRCRPGNFIAIGSPLADVWRCGDPSARESNTGDLTATLNETVIVGIQRTPRQDVECAIEELVEIAVRALSPGINDPFTAMNCIDRLGAALGRFAERKLPAAYCCDEEGRLRIIVGTVSFANALDASFDQIRQYGHNSVAVTIRLLEALASVAEHVQRDEDRAVVKLHAEMVSRHTESFSEEHDKRQMVERFQKVHRLLIR